MKHTDFYTLTNKVQQLEIKELIEAINLHGGSYEWKEDDEKPIIAVNPNTVNPDPTDMIVAKVTVTDKWLTIFGVDYLTNNELEIRPSDVFVGQLSCIIDSMDEINGIDDVSTKTGLFVLVEFPEDSSYFEEKEIGYPCCNSEDNGARYVSVDDYIKVFTKEPVPAMLYTVVQWPESQELLEEPDFESYSEAVLDEKGLNDFICPAYWVQNCSGK